jgi:glutathione reductase (NADPH)
LRSEQVAYDLVVIGGGSGGVRAARVAAEHGARVALVESGKLGGTCVHAGCVPKKLLVFASRAGRVLKHADRFGFDLEAETRLDWPRLLAAVRA